MKLLASTMFLVLSSSRATAVVATTCNEIYCFCKSSDVDCPDVFSEYSGSTGSVGFNGVTLCYGVVSGAPFSFSSNIGIDVDGTFISMDNVPPCEDVAGDEGDASGDEGGAAGDEGDASGDEGDAAGDEGDAAGDEGDATGQEDSSAAFSITQSLLMTTITGVAALGFGLD